MRSKERFNLSSEGSFECGFDQHSLFVMYFENLIKTEQCETYVPCRLLLTKQDWILEKGCLNQIEMYQYYFHAVC